MKTRILLLLMILSGIARPQPVPDRQGVNGNAPSSLLQTGSARAIRPAMYPDFRQTLAPAAATPTGARQFSSTPAVLSAPGCTDTSGTFYLQTDNSTLHNGYLSRSADGYYLLPGYEFFSGNNTLTMNGFLAKTDDKGGVQWACRYANGWNAEYGFSHALALSDGGILLAGSYTDFTNTSNHYMMYLVKVSGTGQVVWQKVLKTKYWQGYSFFDINDVQEDGQQHVYIAARNLYHNNGMKDVPTLIKIDLAGNILWSKSFFENASFSGIMGLDLRPGEVRLFGRQLPRWSVGDHTGGHTTTIYRLAPATGDTLSTKAFYPTNTPTYMHTWFSGGKVTRLQNGNIALSGRLGGYTYIGSRASIYPQGAVAEFTPALEFVRGYFFSTPLQDNNSIPYTTVHPDGKGVFTTAQVYSGYTTDVLTVQFDNGRILKQRIQHNQGYSSVRLFRGLPVPGGDVIVKLQGDSAGNTSRTQFYKMHYSDTGSVCLGSDTSMTSVGTLYMTTTQLLVDSIKTNQHVEVVYPLATATPTLLASTPGCRQESRCDTLDIHGRLTSCNPGQELLFTAYKNKECGSWVQWSLDDNSDVQQWEQINDTTLRVRFRQGWQGYLKAALPGRCGEVRDSVWITVLPAPGALSLGPDTSLCPGNTLLLNARRGYASYRWHDGSTDSTFRVSTPGTYAVETADACGGTFRDTVIFTAAPPVPLDLGPDRTKCNSDTLHLDAPAGFIAYQWGTDYNLSSTTAQNVVVNPGVDTAYYLRAEKTPGCYAFDTVRVTVHTSPPLDLGRDTSFCPGGNVWLRVPDAFSDYQWSGTATTRDFRVYAKGVYWLRAVTPEGCVSTDTLEVLEVYKAPAVQLDGDTTLCTGTERTLDAGPYAAYEWQDGSTGRTFTASAPGFYRVRVVDANGCSGADSVRITRLLPLPGDFLPADTALCSYGTLALKPLSAYAKYAWSNGATTPALTIDRPGRYTLQVTDGYGCTGTDEIVIHPKECMKGLYVPNAFTPNKDGRNDVLRAMLFGPVKSYEFTVYNRWGEVVFRTGDPYRGWDGTYRGRPQDTNVFVWTCRYQLEGEDEKRERGTVVVIR